jgi:methionyl-tRNA formyltransferase
LFNLHLSDPAFVRGLPPILWEVLDGRDSIVLTLHRLTSTLDGGDVIHQQAMPIVWQPTLGATLRATRATFDRAIPGVFERGLRQILDGTARPRPIVPGPLRTMPSAGQLLEANRICRKRWRELQTKAR